MVVVVRPEVECADLAGRIADSTPAGLVVNARISLALGRDLADRTPPNSSKCVKSVGPSNPRDVIAPEKMPGDRAEETFVESTGGAVNLHTILRRHRNRDCALRAVETAVCLTCRRSHRIPVTPSTAG